MIGLAKLSGRHRRCYPEIDAVSAALTPQSRLVRLLSHPLLEGVGVLFKERRTLLVHSDDELKEAHPVLHFFARAGRQCEVAIGELDSESEGPRLRIVSLVLLHRVQLL